MRKNEESEEMSPRSPFYSRLMMSPKQKQMQTSYFETPSTFIEGMTASMAMDTGFMTVKESDEAPYHPMPTTSDPNLLNVFNQLQPSNNTFTATSFIDPAQGHEPKQIHGRKHYLHHSLPQLQESPEYFGLGST